MFYKSGNVRKAFVLLSLFIFCSGFVVPSTVSNVTNNSIAGLSNITTEKSTKILLQNINIDEQEIFKNVENKTINLNERSFIFINKNSKKKFSEQFLRKTTSVGEVNKPSINERQEVYPRSQRPLGHPLSHYRLEHVQNQKELYSLQLNKMFYPKITSSQSRLDQDGMRVNEYNKIEEHTLKFDVITGKSVDDRVISHPSKKLTLKDMSILENQTVIDNQKSPKPVSVQPGLYYNNMRFLSHTQRKPNVYNRCGLEPGWLHCKNFVKNPETATFSSIMYNDEAVQKHLGENIDYDKLEKYLKETLAEAEMSDEQIIINSDNYTGKRKKKSDHDTNESDEQNSTSKELGKAEAVNTSVLEE